MEFEDFGYFVVVVPLQEGVITWKGMLLSLSYCGKLSTVFGEELSWLYPVICTPTVSWGLWREEGLYSKEEHRT